MRHKIGCEASTRLSYSWAHWVKWLLYISSSWPAICESAHEARYSRVHVRNFKKITTFSALTLGSFTLKWKGGLFSHKLECLIQIKRLYGVYFPTESMCLLDFVAFGPGFVAFGPDFVNVCNLSRSIISYTWNQHVWLCKTF